MQGKIWDQPSKITLKRPKLGGAVISWYQQLPSEKLLFPYEYIVLESASMSRVSKSHVYSSSLSPQYKGKIHVGACCCFPCQGKKNPKVTRVARGGSGAKAPPLAARPCMVSYVYVRTPYTPASTGLLRVLVDASNGHNFNQ